MATMILVQVNATLRSTGRQKIIFVGHIEGVETIFQTMRKTGCTLPEWRDIWSWHIQEIGEQTAVMLSKVANAHKWDDPENHGHTIK